MRDPEKIAFAKRAHEMSFSELSLLVVRFNIKGYRKDQNSVTRRLSRNFILKRDNHKCFYCGRYGDTVDHVVPTSEGGSHEFSNCVTACWECNHKKDRRIISPQIVECLQRHHGKAGNK